MPNINDIEMGDDDELTPQQNTTNPPQSQNPTNPAQVQVPNTNQTNNPSANPQINIPTPPTTSSFTTYSAPSPRSTAPEAINRPPQVQPRVTATPQKVVKPINLKARKRAILGCFGAFFVTMILLLVFSFIFIANANGASENPIARLLGVDPTSFVNGLITFIHIIFLLAALGIFLITMSGFVKILTAKKDDKDLKKQGIKVAMVSGIVLVFFLIIWLFAFVYLDGKRIVEEGPILKPIITTPEETINLEAPVLIKFDATNIPYDSKNWQIVSYNWNFGDEGTATGVIVSHTYTQSGVFDVNLGVRLRNKDTNEERLVEYPALVSIAGAKLESVIVAEPLSGEIPLKVTFDGSKSMDQDSEIDTYEWDLDGDGEYDDGNKDKVEYTYEKIGKYNVSLRVTNLVGDFDTTELEIEALESLIPQAVIEINGNPTLFEKGRQYIFSADKSTSPSGKIESYEWDFGDGTPLVKTRTASHSFEKEGLFNVKLLVIDEKGKEGELTKEIQIGSPKGAPSAEFQTDLLQGKAPLEITFDGSLSTDPDNNIVQYEWDFDSDGKTDAFDMRAKYTYKEAGTYTATLRVTDSDDNVSTATQVIKVTDQGIVVDLKADRIEGTVPVTIQFDASGSDYPKGQITSYRWDFGDNTTPKLGSAKISHKYDKVGTYTASVEVIASDNTTAKKEMLITVREVALFSCFVSVFKEGPAPLTTAFDPACSTGTISGYFWDFGDGTTSSELKPTHTFENPGDYTVSLEVSDADNTVDRSEVVIKVLAQ
ncbi:MAG: PKD domain-containing protein [Candidatus Gracilibacteria bacterium]|jgi:PKD repeat protein|nr:PKD domain-containing protein [Candidatus Gracilibacteria bacterium]